MVTVLRSIQRRHVQRGLQEFWHSFAARDQPAALADGFGFLVAFDEMRIPTGDTAELHSVDEDERVTYVHKGALSQEDTTGKSEVIHAGEFQHMSAGRRTRQKETSVARTDWAHIFRISLRPSEVGIGRDQEQRRFTAAERRNRLCVVASPDGRKGSLHIHQDALICSAILDPGHHIVHQLEPGRSAWLHIVYGEGTLNDIVLTQGDSVGVANEPSVSLTVEETTEILLVDLGPDRVNSWDTQSSHESIIEER